MSPAVGLLWQIKVSPTGSGVCNDVHVQRNPHLRVKPWPFTLPLRASASKQIREMGTGWEAVKQRLQWSVRCLNTPVWPDRVLTRTQRQPQGRRCHLREHHVVQSGLDPHPARPAHLWSLVLSRYVVNCATPHSDLHARSTVRLLDRRRLDPLGLVDRQYPSRLWPQSSAGHRRRCTWHIPPRLMTGPG